MRIHRSLIAATAAFALAGFAASLASAATNITIVGAGKGAGAFRMAAGLAEAVNKTSKTVNVTNRESKGFVANTRLVASGRSEIGISAWGTNFGRSIGGMPSFGGPPERISENSTEVFEKSVSGQDALQNAGSASAGAAETTAASARAGKHDRTAA